MPTLQYIGSDQTGGSSGGPWWLNLTSDRVEIAAVDSSPITDPARGNGAPWINGVNSHKRCSQSGCPAGLVFTHEMGSPQFREQCRGHQRKRGRVPSVFQQRGVLSDALQPHP